MTDDHNHRSPAKSAHETASNHTIASNLDHAEVLSFTALIKISFVHRKKHRNRATALIISHGIIRRKNTSHLKTRDEAPVFDKLLQETTSSSSQY